MIQNDILRNITRNIFYWTMFYFIFSFVRFNHETFITADLEVIPVFYDIRITIVLALFAGFFIGLFNALLDFKMDQKTRRGLSMGRQLFTSTIYHVALSLVAVIVSYQVVHLLMHNFIPNAAHVVLKATGPSQYFIFIVATIVASIAFNTFKTLEKKIGRKQLKSLLSGKYIKPQEEQRIFMFLDLKSSTTIAEEIGHEKYSSLLQDCFIDLTKAIAETGAELYQYVGDEVVLTWSMHQQDVYQKAVESYFIFKDTLLGREKHYRDNYNLLPQFKAGLNSGKVMVAEIGIVRRDIAYHGDTINTAARIQGKCNDYDAEILIPEEFSNKISEHHFVSEFIGDVLLKGKNEALGLYKIAQTVS